MRKNTKKRCGELINTIEEAHAQIIKFIDEGNTSAATALLGDCQDAAVAIGNLIESQEGEGTEAVKLLEDYCETLYHINEDITGEQSNSSKNIEKKLNKEIRQIQSSINALPTRIEAVFMPYNVTMWDSLESIWMAADADENCDAYVVPIPYYDKNPDGSIAKVNYDIDKYPDYVPVINHEEFNLADHYPDMIFFHNPYDDHNFVTSVHPNYYSFNLKKYTDCLVYVPYYATSGMMSEGQRYLPSYMIADYIVVQSKDIIRQFDNRVPREKFLPLGSPKYDRVIQLCKNPPEPSAEWKEKMAGKRVYFYNTSLGGLLEDTESFLRKMEYVFNTFKEVNEACLLWRPHPLFESTLDSMRPEYRQEYDRIKNRFIEENIGILDTNPDIAFTIAQCDAYIGDSGTSVISLFEAAGKAVFLLDNRVAEKPEKDAWKGMYSVYPTKDNRFNRAVVMPEDKLFWAPGNDLKYEFFCDLPKDKYHWGFCLAFSFGGNIYVFPRNAQEILVISEETKKIRHIELEQYDIERDAFDRALVFGEEYVFLIPNRYPDIVRFSFKTGKIDYIKDLRDKIWTFEQGERRLCACGFSGKYRKLFLCEANNDTMLSLNLDTMHVDRIELHFGKTMLAVISEDWSKDQYFWFLPYDGTEVIRWNRGDNSFKSYDLKIEGLYSYNTFAHYEWNSYFFSSIAVLGDKVIFAPRCGSKFVKLDPGNGKTEEWIPPFKIYMENKGPHYITWDRGWFVWGMDGRVCGYANSPERITYAIDFDDNRATPLDVEINKEDIAEQYCKGFSSESSFRPVCCMESPWNTLSDIATNNITGNKFKEEDQMAAFLRINASGDGECGSRIYQTIVKDIIK